MKERTLTKSNRSSVAKTGKHNNAVTAEQEHALLYSNIDNDLAETVPNQKYIPALSSVFFYIVANAEQDPVIRRNLLTYLHEQGYDKVTIEDAPFILAEAIQRRGEKGKYDLAMLHPDKRIIENSFMIEKGLVSEKDLLNSCGCSSADGTYGATDTGISNSNKEISISNALIIGGIAISALALMSLVLTERK